MKWNRTLRLAIAIVVGVVGTAVASDRQGGAGDLPATPASEPLPSVMSPRAVDIVLRRVDTLPRTNLCYPHRYSVEFTASATDNIDVEAVLTVEYVRTHATEIYRYKINGLNRPLSLGTETRIYYFDEVFINNIGPYTFTVVLDPQNKITETDETNNSKTITSQNYIPPCSATPRITVIAPSQGQTLNGGFNATIRWSQRRIQGNVKVGLTTDAGNTFTPLAEAVAATARAASVQLPDTPTTNARIRVSSVSNPSVFGDSQPFTIATIVVNSPIATDTLLAGAKFVIKWTPRNVTGLVRIDFSAHGNPSGDIVPLVLFIDASVRSKEVVIPVGPNPTRDSFARARIIITSRGPNPIKGVSAPFRFKALQTRVLTMGQAEAVGGTFPTNSEERVFPCQVSSNPQSDGQIETVMDCGQIRRVLSKANPEYFKNVLLKNGWRVSSVSVRDDGVWAGTGLAQFSFSIRPSPGSTNPYTRIHIDCNARTVFKLFLTAQIVGPPGADPLR